MANVYDRGGLPTEGPIDKTEHKFMDWYKRIEALSAILTSKGISQIHQTRRAIESIDPEKYEEIGYYDRRVEALETLMVESGVLTTEEIDLKVAELDAPWSK